MAKRSKTKVRLVLDHAGLEQVLKSPEVRNLVENAAEGVAATIRASTVVDPDKVTVDSYTTDRAGAAVHVNDLRARLWQARDGLFTRSAAHRGLEVKSRKT